MTAAQAPAPPAPPPSAAPPAKAAVPAGPVPRQSPRLRARLRAAAGTTPGRYRLWSVAVALVLAAGIAVATTSAIQMRSSTRRALTNSGPVLVATQQLVSSLAEADAAASAAFLSGKDEDPEQRRLYEQALARASQQIADVASLAGDDRSIHAAVIRISVQLTRYAGLVEAARASNGAGVANADDYLTDAIRLAASVVDGDVRSLSADARDGLRRDEDRRTAGLVPAVVALVVALALLALGQLTLMRQSRRVLNIPLALATVATVVALAWLGLAASRSGDAQADARRKGYDSIVLTADLSSAGFGAKADETLAVITGDRGQRQLADTQAAEVATAPVTDEIAAAIRSGRADGSPGGLLGAAAESADVPRERAAVAEAALRWQRYRDTVDALRVAPTPAAATAIATGRANADFNGFNFSTESILGQNRDQFLRGLDTAADRTSGVPAAVLLLLLGALAASLLGFQLRINEYR